MNKVELTVFYSEVLKQKKTICLEVMCKDILSKDKLCSSLNHLFIFKSCGNPEMIVGRIILDANCKAEKKNIFK